MRKSLLFLLLALIFVSVLRIFLSYKEVFALNRAVDIEWEQIEPLYKAEFDMIPGITQAVKGFASQGDSVFADIAEARTRYSGANSAEDQVLVANQLGLAVKRLLVVAGNYPDLASSRLFTELSASLAEKENSLIVPRQKFNEAVEAYNLAISGPSLHRMAVYFGFRQREVFVDYYKN